MNKELMKTANTTQLSNFIDNLTVIELAEFKAHVYMQLNITRQTWYNWLYKIEPSKANQFLINIISNTLFQKEVYENVELKKRNRK